MEINDDIRPKFLDLADHRTEIFIQKEYPIQIGICNDQVCIRPLGQEAYISPWMRFSQRPDNGRCKYNIANGTEPYDQDALHEEQM